MQYRHILAATDFSTLGDAAVERAASLATSAGAELTLVHVLEDSEPAPAFSALEVQDEVARLAQLRAAVDKALAERAPSGITVHRLVLEGEPADTLVAALESSRPDLVVLATHGRKGLKRLLLGSVTERVVRESPRLGVDVLVVTPNEKA